VGGERDLLDRLLARTPALVAPVTWGVARLRPGSPVRKRFVNLLVGRAFSAMERSDVELVLLNYEPDAEIWMNGMEGVGIGGCHRGHDGIRALYAEMDEAFADWGWTPRSIADGGDRVAVRADFLAHGGSSGVRIDISDGGTAVWLSPRGLAARQDWFIEAGGWAKACEAAGLQA
jgi:hypothetical protein